ncbi:hypothetical protein [Actinomadura sp. WMMA1423]|uniref:baeRF2 domain-containing protein n=1 Tax=Actinomadura sp. WMMA1423 TaxID=2591108 RepID=UPI0011469572|nr:hypothetical protein [Actinomadura sp. WMMA1423]
MTTDAESGMRTLRRIVSGEPVTTAVEMPEVRLPDVLLGAPVPYVRPLVAWLQERPPHVLALADREGADIEIHHGGIQQRIVRKEVGADDGMSGAVRGAGRRNRRAPADPGERNAVRVARAICDELLCSPMELLLIAGDIRVVYDVDKRVPGGLRRRVSVLHVPCVLTRGDAGHRLAPRVDRHVRAWVSERNRRLLTRITEGGGSGDWAVAGAQSTLDALSRGRVRVLVAVDDPRDRRVAWFDRSSARVALSPDAWTRPDAPADAVPVIEAAPLVDVALRAALLTGAEARLVPPGTPDAPVQGLGALCRFGG